MLNLKVEEIAKLIDCQFIGNGNTIINKLNRIEDSCDGDLTFLARADYEKYMTSTEASCVIVGTNYEGTPKDGKSFIISDNPYFSFVQLIKYIDDQKKKSLKGVHPSAVVADTAKVSQTAYIGANCYIGENCFVGENVVLYPNVVLYDNVAIAEGSVLNSNVVCYNDTIIGKDCVIHSGAVIGADGFGFIEDKESGSYEKIPQIGNVVIGDYVEIGANATIDRALIGSTIVENGVKLDNMVHIAHNCYVGENTGIAAQTGISGSSKIGKRNRFGGQVGLAGHLETADDVTLIAQSGVSKSVNKPGIYFGTPIKERLQAFKIEACIRRLPELFEDVDKIKKKISE